jgi:hypothetical protein
VFVAYLSTAKPVDLLRFYLERLHWLRPKPFQKVEIASPPGVELALEPLEASEGEAKSRFRGSIRLRLISQPFFNLCPRVGQRRQQGGVKAAGGRREAWSRVEAMAGQDRGGEEAAGQGEVGR